MFLVFGERFAHLSSDLSLTVLCLCSISDIVSFISTFNSLLLVYRTTIDFWYTDVYYDLAKLVLEAFW